MTVTEEVQAVLKTEFADSGSLIDDSFENLRRKIAEDMKSRVPSIVERVQLDYKIR